MIVLTSPTNVVHSLAHVQCLGSADLWVLTYSVLHVPLYLVLLHDNEYMYTVSLQFCIIQAHGIWDDRT